MAASFVCSMCAPAMTSRWASAKRGPWTGARLSN